MINKHAQDFDDLLKGYQPFKVRMIQQAAGIALAFFKTNFVNQGFTDSTLQKWPSRKGGARNKGRATLIDRGILKRSIRIKSSTITGATIGIDPAIKYAEIHNFGGTIPLTPKMRRFFWAMFYKFGGGNKRTANNEQALFWRNLALSKNSEITIPKRQFIGDSRTLDKKVFAYVTQELGKFLKV